IGSICFGHYLHYMLAGAQLDAWSRNHLKIPAGIRNLDRAGLIDAINLDMKRPARSAAPRHPCLERVSAGGSDVDRVVHPVASLHDDQIAIAVARTLINIDIRGLAK